MTYDDYWRSTPLINKQWFMNPGLTLEIFHFLLCTVCSQLEDVDHLIDFTEQHGAVWQPKNTEIHIFEQPVGVTVIQPYSATASIGLSEKQQETLITKWIHMNGDEKYENQGFLRSCPANHLTLYLRPAPTRTLRRWSQPACRSVRCRFFADKKPPWFARCSHNLT